MDIKNILTKASMELKEAGSPTPRIDAFVLLGFVLNKRREYLTIHNNEPLNNVQYSRFRAAIRRRKKGEPIAYITKRKEFFGYDYFLNKNVLIPRSESEMLVENALKFIKSKVHKVKSNNINIMDVGTGSGCIIISIIKELYKDSMLHAPRPTLHFFASDISKKALYVARKNAKLHKVKKQIKFLHSNLFINKRMQKSYDLIIANLPYVPKDKSKRKNQKSKLWKDPLLYEPENSIFADELGMEVIKMFIGQVKNRINNNGLILVEADPRNIKNINIYAKKHLKNSNIEIIKDLSGKKRVLKVLT